MSNTQYSFSSGLFCNSPKSIISAKTKLRQFLTCKATPAMPTQHVVTLADYNTVTFLKISVASFSK